MVEDVEDLSDESSVISALEVDCDSSIEEAEVVESGYESNSDVESEFTNDGEIMEVWTRDSKLTLDENFTPPSERQWTFYLDTDDDLSMASTNSFDSYNHRLSWSPDNATNNPELEVRLW